MTDEVSADPMLATSFPQMIRATAAAYGDDPAVTLQAGDAGSRCAG